MLRAAVWRAARSGLEGDLLDLPRSARPVPAAEAVRRLVTDLRPQLEATGDWEQVSELTRYALERGSSAARQRRAYERRGRLADVVDLLLDETRGRVRGPLPGCADLPVAAHVRRRRPTRSSGPAGRSPRTVRCWPPCAASAPAACVNASTTGTRSSGPAA